MVMSPAIVVPVCSGMLFTQSRLVRARPAALPYLAPSASRVSQTHPEMSWPQLWIALPHELHPVAE